ncbi:hypothetical protein J1N35_043098, partial [Gossypium stocksii]
RTTVVCDDPCDPKENFRLMGLQARVAHMPKLALPVWFTRTGPKNLHTRVDCPCGHTRPTWPSPCGSHGHHTIVSCAQPCLRQSHGRVIAHGHLHG